jgi:zinc finger SWIM domain-containing protein 3
VIVPKVGISFASESDAYEMYNTYAGMIGFSIRKSIIKRRAHKTIYIAEL